VDPSLPRREVLAGFAALAAVSRGLAAGATDDPHRSEPEVPAPGLSFDTTDIAGLERIVGIRFTDAERAQILRSGSEHRETIEALAKAGPLPETLAPACVFRAERPGRPERRVTDFGDPRGFPADPPPPPLDDDGLAFAPVTQLAAWLRSREVTSERLVRIGLDRIRRLDPKLQAVITVCATRALDEAAAADRELDAGRWRGPLHGVPYGLKDLFDTADIPTTWGAEPFRQRVPREDAWVVRRLREAGAVLLAKTAVGALAYGDLWFGGRCRSPWNLTRGSSGSSAGSAAGVAAGLFPFAIGTETLGSIVSPCHRCGAVGLRPTFGRVPRTGCMALVWSMDKVGPIARSVSDAGLVLAELNGFDAADPSSVERPFHDDPARDVRGLRVGFVPAWLEQGERADLHRRVLEAARDAGAIPVPIAPPEFDPAPLLVPLLAESAAAFEELTRSDRDDELAWQDPEAWPNTFRRTWLVPAIALVQADRLRRQAMDIAGAWLGAVDCVLTPNFAGGVLTLTNATGHPTLALPVGFDASGEPYGMSVVGRLFDEGTPLRLGRALEARLGMADRRPPLA